MTIPRPTSNVDWATTAGRRVEPDVGTKGTGFVEAQRTPARIANWVTGLAGDWQKWFGAIVDANEEHTYQTPKARTLVVPGFTVHGGSGWTIGGVDVYTRVNIDIGVVDLSKELRTGETLTTVTVQCSLGRNAVARGIWLQLMRYDHTAATDVVIASDTSAMTAGAHTIVMPVSGTGEAIDRTRATYRLQVLSSDNAAAGAGDRFKSATLAFRDPGPRNA